MKKTIEEIWYGNLIPYEKRKKSEEASQLTERIACHWEVLYESLNEEQKKELHQYDDCLGELFALLEKDAFSEGFRLGAALMIDTLV